MNDNTKYKFVGMHLHACVHMHVRAYTCACIVVCTRIYIHVHAQSLWINDLFIPTYTSIHMHVHVCCIHVCRNVDAISPCAHMCVYNYTYTLECIRKQCMHKYIYIYLHMFVQTTSIRNTCVYILIHTQFSSHTLSKSTCPAITRLHTQIDTCMQRPCINVRAYTYICASDILYINTCVCV